MPKLTRIAHIGFGKESSWGSAAATLTYMPFDSVKPTDDIKSKVDDSKRGNISKDYAVMFTTQNSTIDVESKLYVNELGHFLNALFGSVSTTGTSPYVQAFSVSSNQKSLTVNHFNGSDERQYAGCIVDEVNIKGDAENEVTVSVKLQGKLGAVVSTTVPSISATLSPIVGAFCSLTIGGSANTNLFGFDITFKRSNKLIFGASNSADPTKAVVGAFEATGKLTFDVEDSTEYGAYAAKTAKIIVLTLGNSASNKVVITFTNAYIEKASWDDGDESLRVDWEFRGLYNATDAGPCAVVVHNTTASY